MTSTLNVSKIEPLSGSGTLHIGSDSSNTVSINTTTQAVTLANDLTVSGNTTITGATTISGNTTITGTTTISGNIIPGSANTYTLGSNTASFQSAYFGTGIYLNGGTTSSNLLDDYEEGSFTPTIQGVSSTGTASYTTQTGKYTKIGQLVDIYIHLNWSSFTGTGVLEVHGLPFTNKSDEAPCGVVMYNSVDIPNITGTVGDYTAYFPAGSAKLRFYSSGDNAGWNIQSAVAAGQVIISIQHRTDS